MMELYIWESLSPRNSIPPVSIIHEMNFHPPERRSSGILALLLLSTVLYWKKLHCTISRPGFHHVWPERPLSPGYDHCQPISILRTWNPQLFQQKGMFLCKKTMNVFQFVLNRVKYLPTIETPHHFENMAAFVVNDAHLSRKKQGVQWNLSIGFHLPN